MATKRDGAAFEDDTFGNESEERGTIYCEYTSSGSLVRLDIPLVGRPLGCLDGM